MRNLSLFFVLFMLNRCGVMGAPVAYVDAYPEPKPAVETPPPPAETKPEPAKPANPAKPAKAPK